MRKALVATLTLAAAVALVVAVSASGRPTAPSTAAAIPGCAKDTLNLLAPGALTIGADNPAYPPWFGGDETGKTWKISDPYSGKGYEAAVAYAVARQLGFAKSEVKWTALPYTSSYTPGKKPFDIYITQVSYKPERAKRATFSHSYYFLNQAVVGRKGTPIAKAKTVAALKNFQLGAPLGTTAYDYIVNHIKPNSKPNVFDTLDQGVKALKNGQIDGLLVDLPTAFYVTAVQVSDGVIVGKLPTKGTKERFGMVLAKGNPLVTCVNRAIDRLWLNGTIAQLQKTWLAKAGAPDLK